MELSPNPSYRVAVAPSADRDFPRVPLPLPAQLLRVLGYVVIAFFLYVFLSVGTMQARSTYVVAFVIGVVNPLWALYALALLAPLYLLDPGKTHMLFGIEMILLGIFAGELRLLGRPPKEGAGGAFVSLRKLPRIDWGVWPHFLTGLALVLVASCLVGFQLLAYQEDRWPGSPILARLYAAAYGAATGPEWTLRSLWNWMTGMLLAIIAARRMDSLAVARWLKLGCGSLIVVCFLALLDWLETRFPGLDFFSFSGMRAVNPDPLQAGRLQGSAGHPGWFAQWIIVMWPGLFLWWAAGRKKRNALLLGALAMIGLALVLSAARVAWLAMFAAGGVGFIYLLRTFPATKRYVLPGIIAGVVLILFAVLIGGEALSHRLIHLLRMEDRARYYVSGLMFLREHPFGIGLGTHYRFYGWLFTPFFRWYQFDYVDSHSLWLHTLIENGPFVPALLLAGLAGVGLEVKKSWKAFDHHTRHIVLALSLTVIGLLVISLAQYIVYIRIVEIALWTSVGALVGTSRFTRTRTGELSESPRGRRLLLLCGVFAIITASMNAGRAYPGNIPRGFSYDKEGRPTFWTGAQWRTVVDRDVDQVSFNLFRIATPAHGTVTWPDGTQEGFSLQPDEYKHFSHTREPRPAHWHAAPEFLRIEVAPLWTPAKQEDMESDDIRGLGVYVGEFEMSSERIRQLKAEHEARNPKVDSEEKRDEEDAPAADAAVERP